MKILEGIWYKRTKRSRADYRLFKQCTGKIWRMIATRWEWRIMTWWPSEERNGNNSWNAPDGWKEFPQSKTIMRGCHQAWTTHLWKNGQGFKRNSSSVFKIREMMTRNTIINCWDAPGQWKTKRLSQQWKWFEIDLGKDLTDEIHTYVELRKGLENISGKLEESGKILGKDLWVRAHWKGTPLKWLLEKEIAPVELNDLNEITTSKYLERIENGNTSHVKYLQHSRTNE